MFFFEYNRSLPWRLLHTLSFAPQALQMDRQTKRDCGNLESVKESWRREAGLE